ncbi:MAG: UMP kinase [Parcubacteria group bacterium]|nr:UMP kinase [Parcubacteria group bacterium]
MKFKNKNNKMYKRILLKLSGEILMGQYEFGVDSKVLKRIASELIEVQKLGVEVVVEIGGGNIYRWKEAQPGINRNVADSMGMLGSVMNALNLEDAINSIGKAKALSPIKIPSMIDYYSPRKVKDSIKDSIIIIGGGTGNQYFTTDTGAVLHALQSNCEIVLKGTNVDGVYDADPEENPDAKKYDKLNFKEVISKKLGVMDMAAFSLADENNLPITVFNVEKEGSIVRATQDENIGTRIEN